MKEWDVHGDSPSRNSLVTPVCSHSEHVAEASYLEVEGPGQEASEVVLCLLKKYKSHKRIVALVMFSQEGHESCFSMGPTQTLKMVCSVHVAYSAGCSTSAGCYITASKQEKCSVQRCDHGHLRETYNQNQNQNELY